MFRSCFLLAGMAVAAKPVPLDCGITSVDLGQVAQGRVVHTDRVCRNVGLVELVVSEPYTACTCLGASLDRRRIPPGGKAHLRMNFHSESISDRVEFAVEIPVRGRDSSTLNMMVSADVRPSVIAVPEYVDMGDFRRNPVRQILVVDTTGKPFSIRQAVSERSEVEIRWTPVELVRMGDKWQAASSRGAVTGYQVTLSARPQGARKSLSDEIEIGITHEIQKTLRIRVVGYSP